MKKKSWEITVSFCFVHSVPADLTEDQVKEIFLSRSDELPTLIAEKVNAYCDVSVEVRQPEP